MRERENEKAVAKSLYNFANYVQELESFMENEYGYLFTVIDNPED
jgi:hypothetical protein